MLIEPILGEGGYVAVSAKFMQGLRERCDKHDIVLIADEVQSGYGRAGEMFASQCTQVQCRPDLLVMAKGIANGLPLSAVAGRADLMNLNEHHAKCGRHAGIELGGRLGGTYGGNAVACAAAIAVLDVFRDERVLENCRERGEQLRAGLSKL